MNEIYKLRRSCGLSQKLFAIEIGVSPTIICKWENGQRTPRPRNLKVLRKFAEEHIRHFDIENAVLPKEETIELTVRTVHGTDTVSA